MNPNWLEFLYDALGSQFGIVLIVDDVDVARQALYRARRSSQDPSLGAISFRVSPIDPASELWLVKELKRESAR